MDERHVGLIIGEDDRLIGIIPVKKEEETPKKTNEPSPLDSYQESFPRSSIQP
jgi:hypothetical protein